jgi:hypothetical protein
MPLFDRLYLVTAVNPDKSAYTLDLPNKPDRFPTFHSKLLCKYVPNDDELFPSRKQARPGPVITEDGEQEWLIDKIIDERTRGQGWQFLVCWRGWGPEEDRCLPRRELDDSVALDNWLALSDSG